jgi:hypothetical protein
MEYILKFDISEYEVLENIEDFQEEISKPEELRFYTLDEQLRDFFEKSIIGGKPTKYQLKQLMYDRDRIKNAYSKLISVTDTEYLISEHRTSLNIPWALPVYSEFSYKPYSIDKEYIPLFDKTAIKQPNYYPRLIKSLSSPYTSTGEGIQISKRSEIFNEEGKNPIGVLGEYIRSKKFIRDDGSYDIIDSAPLSEADDIKIAGYFLKDRGVDIPKELVDHPFLKSTKPYFYKTDHSLLDVFPSVQAILEHGVPITSDPYNEGLKYLKIYDVKLSQIPWDLWRSRFPPVEQKNTSKSLIKLDFPKEDEKAPSDVLLKAYNVDWFSGLNERYWLSLQIDSGWFIPRLLMSRSSQNGLMALGSPEGPQPNHPNASIDICQHLTSDFDTFLNSGLYRYGKKNKDGIEVEDGKCITVGHIQQEKSSLITRDRIGWKETTETEIQMQYKTLLKIFQVPLQKEEYKKYEKIEAMQESERRRDVLAILEDEERTSDDKAKTIELILRDLQLDNKQFFDNGKFVVCQHTLSILHGNLEENPKNFYVEWTSSVLGKRVCKHCGEEVSGEITVAVDEYDQNGRLVATYESLSGDGYVGHTTIDSFTNSFVKLRSIFDFNHAGELALFLLMASLQILPQETQIVPIISLIRELTKALKSRAKISEKDQNRIEGILCIPALLILLQVHSPFLIPKRSVNNKPFQLSGFPRDSDKPDQSPILDSVISIFKKIMEEVPSKGSITEISRQIISKPQKVREESIPFIKVFAVKFKSLLELAKERYVAPEEEPPLNLFVFPFVRIDNPIFKTGDVIENEINVACKDVSVTPRWITKKLPSVIQKPLVLDSKINASPDLKIINAEVISQPKIEISKKEIEKNIGLGLPKEFKIFEESLKGDYSTFVVIVSRLLDLVSQTNFDKEVVKLLRIQLESINDQSASMMRDIAKGLMFKLMHAVKSNATVMRNLVEKMKTDLVIKMTIQSKEKAEAEEFSLRTKETNLLKSRYREMTDTRRELVKMLVDIGISDFVVTNEDRELFAKKYERDLEQEYLDMQAELDVNRPEEGFDAQRDYVDNGDVPVDVLGREIEVDHGDYGDRGVRDYNDYTSIPAFDE